MMDLWMIYVLAMVMFWFISAFAVAKSEAEHKYISIFIAGVFWPLSIAFMFIVVVIQTGEKLGKKVFK